MQLAKKALNHITIKIYLRKIFVSDAFINLLWEVEEELQFLQSAMDSQ